METITPSIQTVIDHISSINGKIGDKRLLPDTFDGDAGRLSAAFNSMIVELDQQLATQIRMQSEMKQQKYIADVALDNSTEPIFVLDANHRIIIWNNAMEEMTGLPAVELIGTCRHWSAFYESETPMLADLILSGEETELKELYGTYSSSKNARWVYKSEKWLENINGERRYLCFNAAPLHDLNGVKVGAIETIHDITDRKLVEIELTTGGEVFREQSMQLGKILKQVEKAKHEWEETLDCISNMVLMCDTFGKIKRCNYPVLEFFNSEFKEISGKNWMSLLSGLGIKVVDFDGRHGHLFEPNNQRHFEVNVSPIKQPGSPLQSGTVVSIIDITAMRTMNIKLEDAFKELAQSQSKILQQEKMASIGSLAAGVAHEINNPMGFISSNLSSLGKYMEKISTFNAALLEAVQAKGDQETLGALNELRKKMKIDFILGDISGLLAESLDGAERVRRIVQDLKSFSHVDAAECMPSSINECLKSTINMARNEIKYVADVEEEYNPDLPLLNCYPQQLNQVFMNILVNAAHAIEEHGIIRIKTLLEADDVLVRISDTGKGIAPEIIDRIFDPFFTTKAVGKGTGLGLSISYDIIKKHGGVMTVDSEVGVGTTFVIRLPLNHKFAAEKDEAG